MRKIFNKNTFTLIILGCIQLFVIIGANAFLLNSIEHAHIIDQTFPSYIMLLLVLLNITCLVVFFRNSKCIGIQTRLVIALWECIALWFWGFAWIYYLLTINLDNLQLQWAAFSFLWEVPVIGAILVTICIFMFSRSYKHASDPGKVAAVYRSVISYPLKVALLFFFFTVFGYTLGAEILKLFAHLPSIEVYKNIQNGFVVSVLLSFINYLAISALTGHIKANLKQEVKGQNIYSRRFTSKIFMFAFVISLGSILLISLYNLEANQQSIIQELKIEITHNISIASNATSTAELTRDLNIGTDAKLVPFSSIQKLDISSATTTFLKQQKNGTILDNYDTNKYVTYVANNYLQKQVISITDTDDFYAPLVQTAKLSNFLETMVILIVLGVVILFTNGLAQRIRQISATVKAAKNDEPIPVAEFNTEDELEELYTALTLFINEMNMAIKERQLESIFLDQERSKLSSLIESLPIGVAVIRAPLGEITLMNKAGIELLKKNDETSTMIKTYIPEYGFSDENGKFYPEEELPVNITLKHGHQAIRSNIFTHHPNRGEIAIRMVSTPLFDAYGKMYEIVIIFQDITKEYELDKAKTEFLYFTTHELRTPMTAIKGLISMILHNDYGQVPDSIQPALADILRSTDSLIGMVNDTLSVSRIESGTLQIVLNDFTIQSVLLDIQKQFTPLLQEKNLSFSMDVPDSVVVHSDRMRVTEIIVNIIGNALKYTQQGGISISHKMENGLLILYMKDTGIGISEADIPKIFSKYGTIAINTQDFIRQPSTGLGLYISHALAKKLGGDLWIERSIPGEGTIFGLSIPLYNNVNN